MYATLFEEFINSGDSLRIYQKETLIFASRRNGLIPLMDYLSAKPRGQDIYIFDAVIGNAAALLAVKGGASEVFSPLGSAIAIKTLDKFNVAYTFIQTVPHILRADGKDICPMEKLSLEKTPEEFYTALKAVLKG